MSILELKIWRGEEYHKHGILQLASYLDQYELDECYLLIFDLRKQKANAEAATEIEVIVNDKKKNIIEVY